MTKVVLIYNKIKQVKLSFCRYTCRMSNNNCEWEKKKSRKAKAWVKNVELGIRKVLQNKNLHCRKNVKKSRIENFDYT